MLAVSSTLPRVTAVTTPVSASIVAMPLCADVQLMTDGTTTFPESYAVATKLRVCPRARMVSISCEIAMDATTCCTLIAVLPLTPAALAETMAEPLDTAIAIPSALTVTTLESVDDHVNVAPSIATPEAVRAVASNCRVPPIRPSGGTAVTSTCVMTGGAVGAESSAQAMTEATATVSARVRRCPIIFRRYGYGEAPPVALDSGTVQLTVVHATTAAPVRALVCFDSPQVVTTVTDESGAVRVSNLRQTNTHVRVLAPGFRETSLIFYPGKRGRSYARVRLVPAPGTETATPSCADGRR